MHNDSRRALEEVLKRAVMEALDTAGGSVSVADLGTLAAMDEPWGEGMTKNSAIEVLATTLARLERDGLVRVVTRFGQLFAERTSPLN
jgi:hypothetical protein